MLSVLEPMLGRAKGSHRQRWIVLCAALLMGVSGCAGETQVRAGLLFDYPVTYLHRPPPRVRHYPRTYYYGRPAYLVHGRWYYSSPSGWVVFREEPRELRAYRERRHGSEAKSRPRRYHEHDERERRLHEDAERRYRSRDAEPQGPVERSRRRYPR